MYFYIMAGHSLVKHFSLARECYTTNTPSAPSRTHRSRNEYDQPLGRATKPLHRQYRRDFFEKIYLFFGKLDFF